MFPSDRAALQKAVTVEYTCRGKRVAKVLPDAYTARQFYAAKLKAGAAPKVLAVAR